MKLILIVTRLFIYSCPSVRQLADTIGINMHTVNKAYSVLKQEGFLTIDRRKGAVISIDADKMRALDEMKQELLVVLARIFNMGKESPETGRENSKAVQP